MTQYDQVQVRKGYLPNSAYHKALVKAYQHDIHSDLLDLSVFCSGLGGQRMVGARSSIE
ncbi:hypothetical protein N9B88_03235 [Rubripirellula sp.]|jgi:hypothetical protein|nr:hypothetical protein [Rubripirellula sp.]MDB4807268.1 hypothetical protein [bacterium]